MTALVVINLNPLATTRRGTRALVRAFTRLAPHVRVVERHFKRVTLAGLDALGARAVVLGPQGVPFDAYPAADRDHLFGLIRALQRPALGICGGHQALVLAHGGAIGPVHGGTASGTYNGLHKELGFRAVRMTSTDPLGVGLPAQAQFWASHVEGVTQLPAGLTLVGRGDPCEVQAVRVRDRLQWGVQFHPERGGDGETLMASFLRAAGFFAV